MIRRLVFVLPLIVAACLTSVVPSHASGASANKTVNLVNGHMTNPATGTISLSGSPNTTYNVLDVLQSLPISSNICTFYGGNYTNGSPYSPANAYCAGSDSTTTVKNSTYTLSLTACTAGSVTAGNGVAYTVSGNGDNSLFSHGAGPTNNSPVQIKTDASGNFSCSYTLTFNSFKPFANPVSIRNDVFFYDTSGNPVTHTATVSVGLPSSFTPPPPPAAHAAVVKTMVPSTLSPAGFQFTLTGPGVNETESTDSNGNIAFTSQLTQAGNYSITETSQTGFASTLGSDCSFSVSFPANSGQTFTCHATNTQCDAPSVTVTSQTFDASGAETVTFDVHSGTTGIQGQPNGVVVFRSDNANTSITPYSAGASDVTVTSTQISTAMGSTVGFTATAVGGDSNTSVCSTMFDPLMTSTIREAGKPQTDSYTGILQSETVARITNGNPGVSNMVLSVNGVDFKLNGLGAGAIRSLDISSALHAGSNNNVSITTHGQPGGRALVLVTMPNGS